MFGNQFTIPKTNKNIRQSSKNQEQKSCRNKAKRKEKVKNTTFLVGKSFFNLMIWSDKISNAQW